MIIMKYVVEDTDVINGLIAQYEQLGWSHTIDLDRGPTMSAHTLTRDGNTLNLSFLMPCQPARPEGSRASRPTVSTPTPAA